MTPTPPTTPAPSTVDLPTDQRGLYGYGTRRGWMANLHGGGRIEFGNHQTAVIVRVHLDSDDAFEHALVDTGSDNDERRDDTDERLDDVEDLLRFLDENRPT
jgi:hypothetical protein